MKRKKIIVQNRNVFDDAKDAFSKFVGNFSIEDGNLFKQGQKVFSFNEFGKLLMHLSVVEKFDNHDKFVCFVIARDIQSKGHRIKLT